MFKLLISGIFIISFLFFAYSCDSPTEPEKVDNYENSYTPLTIGMVKQFFDFSDSSYQNFKISGKAYREDGQKVFIEQSSYPLFDKYSYQIDSHYSFIKDGFYYATDLIKSADLGNSFYEARVAMAYPKDGDSWYINDKNNFQYTAHYVGELNTPAGIFKDVFSFRFYDEIRGDTVNDYYVKGIGSIGYEDNYDKVLVNYVKVGDKEYGKQVQAGVILKK